MRAKPMDIEIGFARIDHCRQYRLSVIVFREFGKWAIDIRTDQRRMFVVDSRLYNELGITAQIPMSDPVREIHGVLTKYFDALYFGNTELFAEIFHSQARLFSATNPDFLVMDVPEYLAVVAGRQSPSDRGDPRADEIQQIAVSSPTTAHARVREYLLPKHFIDELTLVRVGGQWKIVSKVWHFDLVAGS
jgi:hypothetical protein